MLFDKTVEVLQFCEKSPLCYGWKAKRTVRAHVEFLAKSNLFAKTGVGAKTAQLTTRTTGIILTEALRIEERFCLPTDIRRDGILSEIVGALVEPVECRLFRLEKTADDYKRPVKNPPQEICSFFGVLTEKYQRFSQEEPMAQNETALVLVTPKGIALRAGDLLDTNGTRYAVQTVHTLDSIQNEYEIYRRDDR